MNDSSDPQVVLEPEMQTESAEIFHNDQAIQPAQDQPAHDDAPSENQAHENIEEQDEAAQLAELATGVRDQDDLERDIGRQADKLLLKQADERDQKRLAKTQKDRDRLDGQVRRLEQKLTEFGNHATKQKIRAEVQHYKEQIEGLDKDLQQIQKRIEERQQNGYDEQEAGSLVEEEGNKRMPGESQREYLIRTGKITPFSKLGNQLLRTSSSLGDVLMDAENEEDAPENADLGEDAAEPMSHRNLLAPGFEAEDTSDATANAESDAEIARRLQEEEYASERPAKRRRLQSRRQAREASEGPSGTADESDGVYIPEEDIHAAGRGGESEESHDGEAEDDFALDTAASTKRKARRGKKEKAVENAATQEDLAGIDDGNETVYKKRLNNWIQRRSTARARHRDQQASEAQPDGEPDGIKDEEHDGVLADVDEHDDEWHLPHPTRADTVFEGGLHIPGDIYPALFDYQKTGVQWMWELYSQQVGGIIGDEMGLGKTVQVISFLAGLHYSKKVTKPIIVVCPATVMQQWVNEFHRWWPPLRVSILHTSGSGMLDVKREARIEDDLEEVEYNQGTKKLGKSDKAAKRIVDKVARDGHVLVTTYSGLQTYSGLLVPTEWEYAVLDEGHKIRNPNTAITIFCKELRTHNRLILSGTPMQNNLTELWSLFDFVFPMRLGTLVDFRNQFEIPIKLGGYANASNLQVETAMKCAETLKDAISPYLLQRFKIDVAADLPKKSERVLFCKLTKLQLENYQSFLKSEEMTSILNGKRQALYGIDILRKICNHPDLVEHKTLSKGPGYGNGAKSGKMQVVKALLEIWRRNGHKTLLFAQHRIMLDIMEEFVRGMDGFNYRRMDGNTSIKDRQDLVDEFNNDPNLHVFLLTTKVGGLGVNLTGANRVIIYDPDWNPSTDIQARERAWRLGQKREVEIYRLMTAGTIEEKIYHRQIFKQFLTNKILRDPKQRQTFQLKDLHDLFTLGGTEDGQTETGAIFKGTEVQLSGSNDPSDGRTGCPASPSGEPGKQQNAAEMSTITGISRQEDFRGNPDEEKQASPSGEEGGQPHKEDRMLSSIFARTGVHSALEHDDIIHGGKKAVKADPEIIAREAKRVAAQAARDLQRSAAVARTIPAGVPTWTGQYGSAGRPEERLPASRGRGGMRGGRGGGPSSASVLANLQSRQGGSASSSRASTPGGRGRDQPKGRDFLAMIRDFLKAHGGSAPTQMLVDHFNRYCGTEQRTAEFREMLKVIARLDKGSRGRGSWVLKEEYRS